MEISDLIKSARIEKGLTQQQLADAVFVTRQTISKWELGKSVPDQASLVLLYQCLDINDNEKKQLSKLIYNKLVDCLEKCLIYRHIRRFAD